IIATLGVYQHASNQYVYLASLFALGFLVFGPQLLIGVAAVALVVASPDDHRPLARDASASGPAGPVSSAVTGVLPAA
ncbi:hypothetical protein LAM40_25530, partial [Mycobacterium tuberculosis]|nr:hypothetical protein [Mycobacterium tuberculosis]